MRRDAHPSPGLKFEPRQGVVRNAFNGDAQREGSVQCLFKLLARSRSAGWVGDFDFDSQLGERTRGIDRNTVLADRANAANDFVDRAGINVNAAHDDHVIDAGKNTPFEREV